MLRQCTPDLFPYIDNPPQNVVADEPLASEEVVLQTATGSLTAAQIEQIFAALPVDMTLVDGQDRVRFFSRPKERIFPRSPAIIGRQVAHCHPPQSVDKVLSIIEAFRQGRENQATFWIRHRGRFILIQYFALRRREGAYLGTLEVSQDITVLRQLEGERRLLAWQDEETNTKEVQHEHT
jgi:PAS domain S-box-containing protein